MTAPQDTLLGYAATFCSLLDTLVGDAFADAHDSTVVDRIDALITDVYSTSARLRTVLATTPGDAAASLAFRLESVL